MFIFGADIVGVLVPYTIGQVESIFVGHNEQGKKCIQVKASVGPDSCLPTVVPVMSGLVFVQAEMHLQWEILRAVGLL